MSNSQLADSLGKKHYSPLLVLLRTSKVKDYIISAYEAFEQKTGVDCSKIVTRIKRHGKYMTNGVYFFRYNCGLKCFQPFRVKEEYSVMLGEFYRTFDMNRSWFWTVTKKTFPLDKLVIEKKECKRKNKHGDEIPYISYKIQFVGIQKAENNLDSLLDRLNRYGYIITKKIIVPEIKERNHLVNYHYHIILETDVDIDKIRRNKVLAYRDLVYDPRQHIDRSDGWINNAVLSMIWKEITKDSYRIKPEAIRSKPNKEGYGGAFNYLMCYLNKGIQYDNVDMIPYLEFAMKSKKNYRISGLNPKGCRKEERKKLPKIKYTLEDKDGIPIIMEYDKVTYVEEEELPDEIQIYYINVWVNKKLWKKKSICEILIRHKRTVEEKEICSLRSLLSN